MRTLIETWDPSQMLSPSQDPSRARTAAVGWAANQTILKGMAIARNTTDNLMYPFVSGGSNGTGTIVGFSKYSFVTDANKLVYFGEGITATADRRSGPFATAPIYRSGTFRPSDLSTAALVAQVTTITPAGTISVGDKFTLTLTRPNLTTKAVTVSATAGTAANVSALMVAAWNADTELSSYATASGTATVILTGLVPGVAFTVAATTTESDGSAASGQTFTAVATTAASGISTANILTNLAGSRILENGDLFVP